RSKTSPMPWVTTIPSTSRTATAPSMGAVPAVNGLDGPASEPTLMAMRLPWAAILLVAILAAQGLLARVVVHCHDQEAVVAVNHQVSCCDHSTDEDPVEPPCGEDHDCDPGC